MWRWKTECGRGRKAPFWSRTFSVLPPLAHGFKQQNGGGLRDIQGIDLAGHGDADGDLTVPDWAHTSVLSAHDQRTGATQIDLVALGELLAGR